MVDAIKQRLTKTEREAVDSIVNNCKMSRLTAIETSDIIKERLNITLSESWIARIRMRQKTSTKSRIFKLTKDRYEFIRHYLDRIDEIKNLQAKFWEEYFKIEDPVSRINSLKEAREQTVLLTDLIEHLPQVSQVDITQTQRLEIATTNSSEQQQEQPTKF